MFVTGFQDEECMNSEAKSSDTREGSVGDPQGILGGSAPKLGDPVGFAPMFCGGSSAEEVRRLR